MSWSSSQPTAAAVASDTSWAVRGPTFMASSGPLLVRGTGEWSRRPPNIRPWCSDTHRRRTTATPGNCWAAWGPVNSTSTSRHQHEEKKKRRKKVGREVDDRTGLKYRRRPTIKVYWFDFWIFCDWFGFYWSCFFGHWSDFTAFVNFNWLLEAGCMVVIQVLQPIKASEAKGFQIRKSQTALIWCQAGSLTTSTTTMWLHTGP